MLYSSSNLYYILYWKITIFYNFFSFSGCALTTRDFNPPSQRATTPNPAGVWDIPIFGYSTCVLNDKSLVRWGEMGQNRFSIEIFVCKIYSYIIFRSNTPHPYKSIFANCLNFPIILRKNILILKKLQKLAKSY